MADFPLLPAMTGTKPWLDGFFGFLADGEETKREQTQMMTHLHYVLGY